MTIRFAHITDLHLADRDFGNHQAGSQDEIWDLLEEVADLCIAEERDLIITGDIFDQPRASWVSHALVYRVIDYCRRLYDRGILVFGIAGNHDLGPDGMAGIQRQPLGVVARSRYFNLLTEPLVLHDGKFNVQLTPLNYDPRGDTGALDPDFFRVERKAGVDVHILLAHGALCPPSMNYPFEVLPYNKMPNDGVDLVLTGHMHDDYFVEEHNGTFFMSCGSLCRRSRTQKREVRVGLIDLPKDAQHPVLASYALTRARPWEDLFVEQEAEPAALSDEMLGLAREARGLLVFEDRDFREVLDGFAGTLSKGTLKRAKYYIEEAEQRLYA